MPYVCFAYFGGWAGATLDHSVGLLALSFMLVATAFGLLYLYRGMSILPSFVKEHCPPPIKRCLQFIHTKATRNQRDFETTSNSCTCGSEPCYSRENLVKALATIADTLSRKG